MAGDPCPLSPFAIAARSLICLLSLCPLATCLPHRPVAPLPLAQGRAFLLPLFATSARNSSSAAPGRAQALRHSLRRGLADARMWLYGHVLTEGYYYTMLGLGTPAQQFALIVDTGSTVTYVPCKSCTHCGQHHQDQPYTPSSSSTYKAVRCDAPECPGRQCGANQVCSYSRHYAEDSTSAGVIASDLASFGGPSTIPPTRILFGCETSETGDLFTQRADGIIGMGKGPLGIMNQLVSTGATEDQFSLCYGGMERGGGAMIVGAIPPPPAMQFIPLVQKPGEGTYYNVALEGLEVGGQALGQLSSSIFNEGYGSVLDSGTTFTYLPGAAFQALKQAIIDAVAAKGLQRVDGPDKNYDDVCFGPATGDPSQLSDFFPSITLLFQPSIRYQLSPENFLFRHTIDSSAYCLGVFENKDRGTLLGGILVRNTMVTYDRVSHRVGLWKTNCSDLFETLTKLEGSQAPPLPSQLANEPPSDVEPTTSSPPQPTNQPANEGPGGGAEPTSPGAGEASSCDGCAARIEVVFRLSLPSTEFAGLEPSFAADVARELSLEQQQVADIISEPMTVTVSDSGGGTVSEATRVQFAIVPPDSYSDIPGTTVARIEGILQRADFSLRDKFGAVTLQSLVVVPPEPATAWTSYWWYIVGAVSLATLAAIVLIIWRRRPKSAMFDAMEEERREEKTALADSTRSHDVEQALGEQESRAGEVGAVREDEGISGTTAPHL